MEPQHATIDIGMDRAIREWLVFSGGAGPPPKPGRPPPLNPQLLRLTSTKAPVSALVAQALLPPGLGGETSGLRGARKLLSLGQADCGLFLHFEILISRPARFALGELLESPQGFCFPEANGIAAISARQILQWLKAARQPMLLHHGHDILDALVPFHAIVDAVLYHNMHTLITFRLDCCSARPPCIRQSGH